MQQSEIRSQDSKVAPDSSHRPWLHRFAVLTACATWVLIWAGGLVTSTDSGLAVPDWPLSYGMLMPPMVGGIFYEHGHRMVATAVGCLTIVLAIWLWRVESRAWLRGLGIAGLAMVTAQGILGGITVLYQLPTPVSVAHATLAQTFFCVTVWVAFATSREEPSARAQGEQSESRSERAGSLEPIARRGWGPVAEKDVAPRTDKNRETSGKDVASLRRLALATTAVVYAQLILGAVVRHTHAALAIPDFPLALGRLVPPLDSTPVVIHFAHRLGALAVLASTALLVRQAWRAPFARFTRPAAVLAALVTLQVILGAFTVWSGTAVLPTTAHVATGALVLATSFLITLRSLLYLKESRRQAASLALMQGA